MYKYKEIPVWITWLFAALMALQPVLVWAQDSVLQGGNKIYLPLVAKVLPRSTALSQADCDSISNEKVAYKLGGWLWPDGTDLKLLEVRSYRMVAGDLVTPNKKFFQDSVMHLQGDLHTAVCLPASYNKTIGQVNGLANKASLTWDGQRLDWPGFFNTGAQAAQTSSDLYAWSYGLMPTNTYGSMIVATLDWGGQTLGQLLRIPSASEMAAIIGSGGAMISLDMVNEQLDLLQRDGLLINPTQAPDGSTVFYHKQPPSDDTMIDLLCGADEFGKYKELGVDKAPRLYAFGGGDRQSCVTYFPEPGSGRTGFRWKAVQIAAAQLMAEKRTPDQEETDKLIGAIEDMLDVQMGKIVKRDPDSRKRCPNLTETPALRAEATLLTIVQAQGLLRTATNPDDPALMDLMLFTSYVQKNLSGLQVAIRYAQQADPTLGRAGLTVWYAHQATAPLHPDIDGINWTIEATCMWTNGLSAFQWMLNVMEGPYQTGVTSSLKNRQGISSLKPTYPYSQ